MRTPLERFADQLDITAKSLLAMAPDNVDMRGKVVTMQVIANCARIAAEEERKASGKYATKEG